MAKKKTEGTEIVPPGDKNNETPEPENTEIPPPEKPEAPASGGKKVDPIGEVKPTPEEPQDVSSFLGRIESKIDKLLSPPEPEPEEEPEPEDEPEELPPKRRVNLGLGFYWE